MGEMQRIFTVEDDDNIREMLLYALMTAGYASEGFASAEELFDALAQRVPTLLLLDIMLPGKDGISILHMLKQHGGYKDIPIIMLTAKGAEMDRIRGLDAGADDFITKPFSVMEVISRIKAVLRRCAPEEKVAQEISVGPVTIDTARRTVQVDAVEIALTYTEFELLHYLMLNKGIALSRDKLLEQVWGYDYNGESRTVDMHIKSLRKKLGVGGAWIATLRNVGYKMGG